MNCKQCIHYEACKGWAGEEVLEFLSGEEYSVADNCANFALNEEKGE